MAIVKYITQGLNETESHLKELRNVLDFEDATNIVISTAYLREKGVLLVEDELKKNKEKIKVFVGIRNGATSKQAIIALIKTGVAVYVVDTGSTDTIFHIKNYTAYNDKKGIVISGSANFTPSGLARNIEGSTIVELDFNNKDDKIYLEKILRDNDELINMYPENVIRIHDESYIEQLLLEGRVVDEETQSRVNKVGKNKGNNKITPRMKLKITKLLSELSRKNNKTKKKTKIVNKTSVFTSDNKAYEIVEIWRSKELKERDLNVPSNKGATNVTGSMLLKKGKYEINQQTYFREEAFSSVGWSHRQDKPNYFEYANVEIQFVIDGIDYGTRNLEIKHDTRTDTKTYLQKQPMTHLIWGDAKELIANRNLLGKELRLYKVLENNKFVISID